MTDLKELYIDEAKVAAIGSQLHKWNDSMEEFCTLDGADD